MYTISTNFDPRSQKSYMLAAYVVKHEFNEIVKVRIKCCV